MKLGSLFDGSGGFPLAGSLCGIEPRWASEVEPYPIAVTRERFPNMKHLGDISKVNGAEIEPVDVITFGSPCQDLSVAGKRAGLKHEANGDDETTRSGLFMEAVRIIKEMREATNGEYPTFALWENVPGAFSSNRGEDFRVVLEELIKIVEPSAVMPAVPQAGWSYSDSFVGDGWSLAYRVFDAKYWGVPQRRRRIHLVVDFRGERAKEVLFKREGLRGYFEKGGTQGQGIAENAERCSGADDREGESNCLTPWDVQSRRIFSSDGKWPALYSGEGGGHGYVAYSAGFCPEQSEKTRGIGYEEEIAPTLRAGVTPGIAYSFDSLASNSMKSANPHSGCRPVEIAKTLDTTDPNPSKNQGGIAIVQPVCYDARGNGDGTTVSTITGDHENRITDYTSVICMATQQGGAEIRTDDKAPTLTAAAGMSGNNQPVACYPIHDQATRFSGKRGDKSDGKGNGLGVGQEGDPMNTLTSGDRHAVAYCTDVGFFNSLENQSPTLLARSYKDPHLVTYWDGGQTAGTLTANNAGGNQRMPDKDNFNCIIEKKPQYIVRRLTPTECARLQGFPDWWGHIEQKESFADEEYRFWLEVRNTHAAINGKAVKEYNAKQMLTWYNKLWTDSAEYKMWGNGIALPPALYVLQGMADVLTLSKEELDAAMTMAYDIIAETEATDLSDAPEEIKTEIVALAEKLEDRENEEEETMEQKIIDKQETENTPIDFVAAAQLRKLAEERKALANLRPNDLRFADDVRALEFAVSVLEAVGL